MRKKIRIDRRALIALSFLFALAACGTSPPPAVTEAPPETARVPEIAVEPLPPSSPEVVPSEAAPPARTQTALAPPARKLDPVDDNPKQLFGLSGKRVAALLGPANFVRRDGPAEVWQYRAADCVLDVFLYRENSVLSVAHVDLRQRRASVEPPRRCFAKLLADRR